MRQRTRLQPATLQVGVELGEGDTDGRRRRPQQALSDEPLNHLRTDTQVAGRTLDVHDVAGCHERDHTEGGRRA